MKRLMLVAAIAVLGFVGWRLFGGSPEGAVRKQLNTVAETTSFNAGETPLARLANAQRLSTFCTLDVAITVDTPRGSQRTFSGRAEVLEAVAGVRSALNGLVVQFLDIEVVVAPDKLSAVANLTARARVPGERDDYIQELKFTMRKIDGDWLISKVETVKTFSLGPAYERRCAALPRQS